MTKYNLTGTVTAINLAKAFAGESQARNRYLFYSDVAKKERLQSVAQVFLETADNERGHAEMFFEYLTEGLPAQVLDVKASVPVSMGNTLSNLLFSAEGEHEERSVLYLKFAEDAKKEGFTEISTSFSDFATVEYRHEKRFLNLHERLKKGMLYTLPYEVVWECLNCGFRTKGTSAPDICPACHHPKDYFKIACKEVYPTDLIR